jgi:glutaryl-CoA dehydrogenase
VERSTVEALYRLDDALSAEERAVRDAVARVVDTEVLPVIGRHFREGTFPAQLIPRLGELGVLGANLSGHGCAGASNVAYGLGLQELERGDSGLRSFASVQGSLVMYPIHAWGSEVL